MVDRCRPEAVPPPERPMAPKLEPIADGAVKGGEKLPFGADKLSGMDKAALPSTDANGAGDAAEEEEQRPVYTPDEEEWVTVSPLAPPI